jgi:hypothetical protein
VNAAVCCFFARALGNASTRGAWCSSRPRPRLALQRVLGAQRTHAVRRWGLGLRLGDTRAILGFRVWGLGLRLGDMLASLGFRVWVCFWVPRGRVGAPLVVAGTR